MKTAATKEMNSYKSCDSGNAVHAARYCIHLAPFYLERLTREKALEITESIIRYWSIESWKHHQRTRVYTHLLIEQLSTKPDLAKELKKSDCEAITDAAHLHDIGEIGIPCRAWPPADRLTPDEIEKIHTDVCTNIIKAYFGQEDIGYCQHLHEVCKHHHERWDGRGYPDRLAGIDIPLSARIVAVADAYDMSSGRRVNSKPFTHEKAVNLIKRGAGKQFDPDIVAAFCEMESQIHKAGKTLAKRSDEENKFEELAFIS